MTTKKSVINEATEDKDGDIRVRVAKTDAKNALDALLQATLERLPGKCDQGIVIAIPTGDGKDVGCYVGSSFSNDVETMRVLRDAAESYEHRVAGKLAGALGELVSQVAGAIREGREKQDGAKSKSKVKGSGTETPKPKK